MCLPSHVPLPHAPLVVNSAFSSISEWCRLRYSPCFWTLSSEVGSQRRSLSRASPSPRSTKDTMKWPCQLGHSLQPVGRSRCDTTPMLRAPLALLYRGSCLQVADDFYTALRTGEVLCQLVNAIRPGMIQKINAPGSPFKAFQRNADASVARALKPLGSSAENHVVSQSTPPVRCALHALALVGSSSGQVLSPAGAYLVVCLPGFVFGRGRPHAGSRCGC